ncbi:MAG TPA: dTMP kinase [Candidatus Rifleibacterium sp.]|nr:dTMP kinase [Candidatus Rifleibacterium sp.]HPT44981.1 dTMP kinase [Candidatus Rifleibacterium sp.]
MTQSLFITFEGPEGSGKSTQIKLLQAYLAGRGLETLLTREPGGTPAGDRIRAVLLDKECGSLEPETEMFLMLAQRCEHLRKVILPALQSGKTVLCDRYFDSSMAYQGYARGIGADKVRSIHASFLPGFLPDVTVLLRIAPDKGLVRARHGGKKQLDRIESETLAFHQRVLDGYDAVAAEEPERYLVVDAEGEPGIVSKKIIAELQKRCSELA